MFDIQQYTIKEFFYADLRGFKTALTTEQLPLVQTHVDKLAESIHSSGKMYRIPLVVTFNDEFYLGGGRNRLAALNLLGVCDDELIPCLHTVAGTSEELIALITGDNASRRSNAAERNELKLAAKFGIGLTYDTIMAKVTELNKGKERDELMKLAIAHALCEQTDFSKNTALSVASSLYSNLRKVTSVITYDAEFDTDGTQLTPKCTEKINVLDYFIEMSPTTIDNILFAITDITGITSVHNCETLRTWTDAGFTYTEDSDNEEYVTLDVPADVQRKASRFVNALWTVADMKSTVLYYTSAK
jgi:hypothetical protein